MWRFKVILIGFLGILIFGWPTQTSAVQAESNSNKVSNVKVVSVSGEISSIDIRLGKLQLEADAARDKRDPVKYNINRDATRVTDPADKKFFKLEDLRVGQYIIVEFNHIPGESVDQEPVAQKIIASPMSSAVAQKASVNESTKTVTTTTTSTTTK